MATKKKKTTGKSITRTVSINAVFQIGSSAKDRYGYTIRDPQLKLEYNPTTHELLASAGCRQRQAVTKNRKELDALHAFLGDLIDTLDSKIDALPLVATKKKTTTKKKVAKKTTSK